MYDLTPREFGLSFQRSQRYGVRIPNFQTKVSTFKATVILEEQDTGSINIENPSQYSLLNYNEGYDYKTKCIYFLSHVQTNSFKAYHLLRTRWMPKLDTISLLRFNQYHNYEMHRKIYVICRLVYIPLKFTLLNLRRTGGNNN